MDQKRRKSDKELSAEFCPRFGRIAVDKGFIAPEQLKEAMSEQVEDDLSGLTHRLIGRILFEKGWMTYQQIDVVLNELFKVKQ